MSNNLRYRRSARPRVIRHPQPVTCLYSRTSRWCEDSPTSSARRRRTRVLRRSYLRVPTLCQDPPFGRCPTSCSPRGTHPFLLRRQRSPWPSIEHSSSLPCRPTAGFVVHLRLRADREPESQRGHSASHPSSARSTSRTSVLSRSARTYPRPARRAISASYALPCDIAPRGVEHVGCCLPRARRFAVTSGVHCPRPTVTSTIGAPRVTRVARELWLANVAIDGCMK